MKLWQETLESIRYQDASMQTLFGGDGRMARRARKHSPRYMRDLQEAAVFLGDVLDGSMPTYYFHEALTTSDFPVLFADILDRQVLAKYTEWPVTWPAIAKQVTVRDFRDAKYFPPVYGADDALLAVPERTEYPEATLNEQAAITYQVKKYGRRLTFSWEASINDDLQQLTDIPERFARAARRTEQRAISNLYVDASGPHASLYTSANKNQVITANGAASNNPKLDIAGLQSAMTVLANMKDEMGEPMLIEAVTLVVPPALEIPARNILNATQIEVTQAGGVPNVANTTSSPTATGEQRLIVQNWMRNNMTLVVDPYIPMIATTANGATSWYLFANPNVSRPALIMAKLRGYEQPQVWVKDPDARSVGGGQVSPGDGDFELDGIVYRVRHVLGSAAIDAKMTVASNGSAA